MRTEREPEHTAKRRNAAILAGIFVLVAGTVSIPARGSGAFPTERTTGSPQLRAGGKASTHSLRPAPQSLPDPTIFASDCTTPRTTFNLGETVCVIAGGLTGRIQWVDPDGFSVRTTDITADPQTDSLSLPATDQSSIGGLFTANNLGRWRLNAITSRNSVNTSVFFTVKDPSNPRVDLSIVKSIVGTATPSEGDPIQFAVTIVNQGPDDAVNTHFVDTDFTNATFKSLTQTSGPAFTCNGSDCTIASLPNGATATFLLNFTAGGAGGVLANTATVTSDTPELNPVDNSAGAAPVKVGTTGPPPTCDLELTAPPAITLFTGPGAASCGVVVNDLDATLGSATATDSCDLAVTITRGAVPAGNNFPVGTTTVSYTATDAVENSSSAIQTVTVKDNTPPTITCPPDVTLEPTCASGAVATWTAPVGSDNCPGVTTAQSEGPPNGATFPIGTTAVAYTASDAAGNQSSCGFTVTVLTVVETLNRLRASVGSSSLTGPQKQGLLPKLDAVLNDFNRGSTNAACNVLSAFIKVVQDDIAHGNITSAQGQAWISSATHVGNTIGCTNNPCS